MEARSPSPADVREAQKRHWTSVADAWAKWFDWTEQNFAPLTRLLRERSGWEPGAAILDIGCGSGYPALAAAAAVRPSGKVTAIDVSPRMLAVTAARAAADGLDNIDVLEMDAENLRFADETFDVVTDVCALMFSPEPERVVREIRRVLKPDGRFGIVVWDGPALNPFSMLILDVISKFIALPPLPAPTAPGPFQLAADGSLESVVRAGGFANLAIESHVMTFEFESVDEYIHVVTDMTGWRRRMERLSAHDLSNFRFALTQAVRPHSQDGRVRLLATVRCAFGSKGNGPSNAEEN
jgi:ubiquinone/menaquinone biosynthesis C-methylase UbiE